MPNIKLHKNLKDNLHCFQACLKMVLDYFGDNYSFKKLDKITGFKKDKWTWSTKALLYLTRKNYNIINISSFDFKRFANQGKKYLKWYYSPDAYKEQNKYSDFNQEQKLTKKLIKSKIKIIKKDPKISDIEKYKKYLAIININHKVLDRLKGYANHSVVITKIKNNHVYFNDPGLPAKKSKAKKNLFNKAINDEVILIKRIFDS